MPAHNMDSHINFRLAKHDKHIIETAALLKGLKPNTYARQKLLESAEKDITEAHQLNTLIISEKNWEQFMVIMEAPVKINKNLKRAIRFFNKTQK